MKKISIFLMALGIAANCGVDACTGIQLKAKDGSFVRGRTLEFGVPAPIYMMVVPRGYQFEGTTPLGKGYCYKSKYGIAGASIFEASVVEDGTNEKGLSVGTFLFPGFAEYTPITDANQSKGLSPTEFPNWLLSQFATIAEVKAALDQVVIAPTVVKNWGPVPPAFHYMVHDKTGACLVIEPIGGKLVVTDNPIGVLTNSPSFDWHLTNLRNYINLSPMNAPPLMINGFSLAQLGQGSGLLGLPGDFTPPSRFVRAVIYSSTLIPADTAEKSVFQLLHVLNQFDIPYGAVRGDVGGALQIETTSLSCVSDPVTLKFYYKTYKDQTIRVIDLKSFDLDAKRIRTLRVDSEQTVVDVSGDFI